MRTLVVCAALVALLTVRALAVLIGNSIQLSGIHCMFPDVAYGSVSGKYLVVWPDYFNGGVFGRLVTGDGAVSGGAFRISDAGPGALYPAVAYDSTDNQFLVTWDTWERTGSDSIYGQRVSGSNGALVGPNIAIGNLYGGIRSAVAWSSTSNCYLVVYAAGLKDGTQTAGVDNVGIRIKTNPTGYPEGSYVIVTGISSPFADGGYLKRQILPRTGEIQIVKL